MKGANTTQFDLNGLGAQDGLDEINETGFDYDETIDNIEQNRRSTNKLDTSTNAFDNMGKGFFSNNNDVDKQGASGGSRPVGLAGALGFGDEIPESGLMNEGQDGMMDEMAMMEEEGMGSEQNSIKVVVYINYDEDDDQSIGLDLGQLFQREDLAKPYNVSI